MIIVLASHNPGKLRELQQLFASLNVSLRLQSEFEVKEADEPHASFVENALAKARHAAHATGHAAIADDSGLCVEALNGAPGVMSAQYAEHDGEPLNLKLEVQADREALRKLRDEANNALLLKRMQGRSCRTAHFVSVIVALRHARDPEPLIAEGRWLGEIASVASGENGFGYDSLFIPQGMSMTSAELSPEKKNALSHRAKAIQMMMSLMRSRWTI